MADPAMSLASAPVPLSQHRNRPPGYRLVSHHGRQFRIPAGHRIIGAPLDLDLHYCLLVLRRHVRPDRPQAWGDALTLRVFCRGIERGDPGIWHEGKSSVTLPVGLAEALVTLIQRAASPGEGSR